MQSSSPVISRAMFAVSLFVWNIPPSPSCSAHIVCQPFLCGITLLVGQLNWFAFWVSISWQHTNTYKYIAGQSHTPLLLWLWYFCWSCWLWCCWWWCRHCLWCPHLPLPREASVARLAETAFPSWVEYDCVFSYDFFYSYDAARMLILMEIGIIDFFIAIKHHYYLFHHSKMQHCLSIMLDPISLLPLIVD